MRALILFVVTAVALAGVVPAIAQSDGMELQRCVWACLARSSGNDDPAYHACVENDCVSRKSPASRGEQSTIRGAERPNRDTISFVQQRLTDLGFDPGPIDGIYGRKTQAAVRAFRAFRGLSEDGGIDEKLLVILRSNGDGADAGPRDLPEVLRAESHLREELSCVARPTEGNFAQPNLIPPSTAVAESSAVFYSHDRDVIRIDKSSIADTHFAGAGDDLIYVDGPDVATQVFAENGGDTVLLCAIGEVTTTIVLGPYDVDADTVLIDTNVFTDPPGDAPRIAIHEINPVSDRVVIRVPDGIEISFENSLFRTVLPIRIGSVRIDLHPALVRGRFEDAIQEAVVIATAGGRRIPVPALGPTTPEMIEGEARLTATPTTLAGQEASEEAGFRACLAPDDIRDLAQPRPMQVWDTDRSIEYGEEDDIVVHRGQPSTGLVHTGAGDDVIYVYEAVSGLMLDGEAGADTFVLCSPAPDGLSLTLGLGSWGGADIDADTVIVAPAMFKSVPAGHHREIAMHSFNPANDRLVLRLPEDETVSYGDQHNGAVLIRIGDVDVSLSRSDDWLSNPFDWNSVIIAPEDYVPVEEARTKRPRPTHPLGWQFGEPRTYSGEPAEPVHLNPGCGEMRDPDPRLQVSKSLDELTERAPERPIPEDEKWLYFSHGDDLVRITPSETTEAVNVLTGRGDDAVYMFDVGDDLTVLADGGADTLVVCSMRGVNLVLSLPEDRFPDRVVIEPPVFLNVPPGIPRTIRIDGFMSVNDRLELRVPTGLEVVGQSMYGGAGVSFRAGEAMIVVHDPFYEMGTLGLNSRAIAILSAAPQ